MDIGQDISTDTFTPTICQKPIPKYNLIVETNFFMVEYVCNRNRITHTIDNVNFTDKLKKEMVCLYKAIQEI